MINLHGMKQPKDAVKNRKRVGRGHGSGLGKTAGRGQKGQKSRSGGGKGPGFEGGQNPIQMRLPKLPGFKNRFKKEYQPVNIGALNIFDGKTEIVPQLLQEKGLIRSGKKPVKILGFGELKPKIKIKAHAFSKSAITKIQDAGGSAETIQ